MKNEDRERQMFGCTVDQLKTAINQALSQPASLAISLLSDAQELQAMGREAEANQAINRAKLVIDTYCVEKDEVGRALPNPLRVKEEEAISSAELLATVREDLAAKYGKDYSPEIARKAIEKAKRWLKAAYGLVDWGEDDYDTHLDRIDFYYRETLNDKTNGVATFNRSGRG